MLMTTTSVVEGQPVTRYLGIVTGEAIIGANVFRDMFAVVRDVVGGRSATYERGLSEAREIAMREMQSRRRSSARTGVIAIDLDYEVLGQKQRHADGLRQRHRRRLLTRHLPARRARAGRVPLFRPRGHGHRYSFDHQPCHGHLPSALYLSIHPCHLPFPIYPCPLPFTSAVLTPPPPARPGCRRLRPTRPRTVP